MPNTVFQCHHHRGRLHSGLESDGTAEVITLIKTHNNRTAVFDRQREYRYALAVRFGEPALGERRRFKRHANFLMLNPSTADELKNDPTVERCQRRAIGMGYSGLTVTNIFALRSTDPVALYDHRDPIGELNDDIILREARRAGIVIAAWGVHGAHLGRGAQVMRMLRGAGVVVHVLGLTKGGHPRHPLYVPYEKGPIPYE